MAACCRSSGACCSASGSGESWFTSGGLRLEPRRGNGARQRVVAGLLLSGWCSLNSRYRETLERRPGTLNHRLEHGVGLLPWGEEERIGLTCPFELPDLLVDSAALVLSG